MRSGYLHLNVLGTVDSFDLNVTKIYRDFNEAKRKKELLQKIANYYTNPKHNFIVLAHKLSDSELAWVEELEYQRWLIKRFPGIKTHTSIAEVRPGDD